jgi:hypothetical protein
MRTTWILLILLTFSVCYAILAGGVSAAMVQHIKNGIPYMTGGIGLEERELMKRMSQSYNLKLAFANLGGHYLSDLLVFINDDGGHQIFETKTTGPWLFVKLPRGKYRVKTDFNGIFRSRWVEVSEELQTVLFHWRNGS